MADIIDDISGEVRVMRAIHRNADFQVTCSADVVAAVKAAAIARNPYLSDHSGIPLTRLPALGTPLVIDPFMAPNTFRVDWTPR